MTPLYLQLFCIGLIGKYFGDLLVEPPGPGIRANFPARSQTIIDPPVEPTKDNAPRQSLPVMQNAIEPVIVEKTRRRQSTGSASQPAPKKTNPNPKTRTRTKPKSKTKPKPKSNKRKRIAEESEEEEEQRSSKKQKVDEMVVDGIIYTVDSEDESDVIEPSTEVENLVRYNKNLKNNVERSMIGKFLFPVNLVKAARPQNKVREVCPSFVEVLESQIRRRVSGIYFRNALQINIYPSPNNTVADDARVNYYANSIKEIMQITAANIRVVKTDATAEASEKFNNLLINPEFCSLFEFEAIGGNHTREAFQKILLNPGDNVVDDLCQKIFVKTNRGAIIPHCLESVIYFDLGNFPFLSYSIMSTNQLKI